MASEKPFILGTAQFGSEYGILSSGISIDTVCAQKMIDLCHLNGVTTIDTAKSYDGSKSILMNIELGEMEVITKLTFSDQHSKYKQTLYDELDRFDRKKITLLVHDPDKLDKNQVKKLMEVIRQAKDEKSFRFGLSIYCAADLKLFYPYMSLIDVVQAPFNILDRRLEDEGLIDKLKSRKVELHSRSAFLQGLLLEEAKNIPKKISFAVKYFETIQNHFDSREDLISCCLFIAISAGFDKTVIGASSEKDLVELFNIIQKGPKLDLNYVPTFDKVPLDLIDPRLW